MKTTPLYFLTPKFGYAYLWSCLDNLYTYCYVYLYVCQGLHIL
jgi:hypothetical protein